MLYHLGSMRMLEPILCTVNQSSIFMKCLGEIKKSIKYNFSLEGMLTKFPISRILVGKARSPHRTTLYLSPEYSEHCQ